MFFNLPTIASSGSGLHFQKATERTIGVKLINSYGDFLLVWVSVHLLLILFQVSFRKLYAVLLVRAHHALWIIQSRLVSEHNSRTKLFLICWFFIDSVSQWTLTLSSFRK